jgi:hypothetical protein
MAHFAKINSTTNLVLEVNVVNNEDVQNLAFPESEAVGITFLTPWNTEGTYWKQTSYNNNFRKNYAGIGYTYDSARDAFIPEQPFNSWFLNENTCQWEPPIAYPSDGKLYDWDEPTLSWKEVVEPNG